MMFATLAGKRVSKFAVLNNRQLVATTRRTFAEDANKPATTTARRSGGPGIFGRISSFLVGAGLTALVTQFYIFQELREGNKEILTKQKDLEARLKKLEG